MDIVVGIILAAVGAYSFYAQERFRWLLARGERHTPDGRRWLKRLLASGTVFLLIIGAVLVYAACTGQLHYGP